MPENPTWEVQLSVYGPVKLSQYQHMLRILKGWREDPFYSDIELQNADSGIRALVTAFASTSELAHQAALVFFGQMLDVLAFQIRQPLYLSYTERRPTYREEPSTIRRIIEEREWKSAFKESRLLARIQPTFLRALGWYRKGLYTEDVFDKFLAFWNSIEVVAGKYHPPIPEDRENKSKSQVWECFKAIWGACSEWPTIAGNDLWIDENYQTRTDIVHGVASIDIRRIKPVLLKLDVIELVALTPCHFRG